MDEYDVVVVGARCAGAATAMLLAQAGVKVAVVDRAEFPSDTLSTHAIARGGVVQLARWGLLDRVLESGAPPIRSVSFKTPDGALVREVKASAGVDHLVAPRRHVLDTIVLDAARQAGATVQTGVCVTDTTADADGRVNGVALRDRAGNTQHLHAGLVVGADGVRSRIARAVGARVTQRRPESGLIEYAYVAGLDADGFEFHVADGSLAGVFPTHDNEANVWICTPNDRGETYLERLDECVPSLAGRVRTATITSPTRKAAGLPNHVLQAAGPGWALVGDAGYHRDPITGHGITDAFRDAELLASAVLANDMHLYGRERNRALANIFDVTSRLSRFPPVDEFIELQKQLSALIDEEAAWLATLPPFPALATAAA
jgi:flavin-dependent dehydrogenase